MCVLYTSHCGCKPINVQSAFCKLGSINHKCDSSVLIFYHEFQGNFFNSSFIAILELWILILEEIYTLIRAVGCGKKDKNICEMGQQFCSPGMIFICHLAPWAVGLWCRWKPSSAKGLSVYSTVI